MQYIFYFYLFLTTSIFISSIASNPIQNGNVFAYLFVICGYIVYFIFPKIPVSLSTYIVHVSIRICKEYRFLLLKKFINISLLPSVIFSFKLDLFWYRTWWFQWSIFHFRKTNFLELDNVPFYSLIEKGNEYNITILAACIVVHRAFYSIHSSLSFSTWSLSWRLQ